MQAFNVLLHLKPHSLFFQKSAQGREWEVLSHSGSNRSSRRETVDSSEGRRSTRTSGGRVEDNNYYQSGKVNGHTSRLLRINDKESSIVYKNALPFSTNNIRVGIVVGVAAAAGPRERDIVMTMRRKTKTSMRHRR